MPTVILTIKPTGMAPLRAEFLLDRGDKKWKHLYGSLGVHLFRRRGQDQYSLRITNGVANSPAGGNGTASLDWMQIELDGNDGVPDLVYVEQQGYMRISPHGMRFATNHDRVQNQAELAALIDAVTRTEPRAFWIEQGKPCFTI